MSEIMNQDLVDKAKRIKNLNYKYRKEYYASLSNEQIEDIYSNIMQIEKLLAEYRLNVRLVKYKIKHYEDNIERIKKMALIFDNILKYILLHYCEDIAKEFIYVLKREVNEFGNALTPSASEFFIKCNNISSIIGVEEYIKNHKKYESVKNLYLASKIITLKSEFYYDSNIQKIEEKQIMLENLYMSLTTIPTIKDIGLRNAIIDYVDDLFMLGNSLYIPSK